MKRVPGKQSNYSLITAELSALYEIPSLSFSDSEERFAAEVVEKATRLFGVRYFTLHAGPPGNRRLLASWGFQDVARIEERINIPSPERFNLPLGEKGQTGLVFMEQAQPILSRERRIFTVFARRVEIVLQTLSENARRKRVEQELSRYREHLEELVKERTSELKMSNELLRREIRERKQAEMEREAMARDAAASKERELMERTNRLASIGLLAAGIAHEVNNPLQGMLSHMHAVRRALPEDFPKNDSIEMVEEGIQSISEIVNKLLTLTRQSGHSGPATAISSVALDFVTQLLEHEFKRAGIKIIRKEESTRFKLNINQQELIQVLINLYINAKDAMPKGGRLTVTTFAEEDHCVICLADTGQGIPKKLLGQILSPFFTTKGARGTGLGLSVAESILRHCGGSIHVESAENKGSTFRLKIPLVREEK
ncbi:MAG: hypothetical protein EOM20_01520 [Spartobacteria bacterium]|nr:hypothetical protein [Spartobacteria bacterium]